ncbi:hypothetical protein [Microbacterium sp. UBA837]|uniref:hypothetical protein n=1 Tax=Microbacterium sp. UBA837 TaxID=1946956 RepID=UPI0025EBE83B|nr:hypothetical protein [Microbacterium sp. UBA837]
MSTMYGADVAQLRNLARQFDSAASRLDDDRKAVGSAIQISAWVGPVALHFRAQWDSDHSRRLHDAAERLRDAAATLRSNADDQERTSAVNGGSGSRSASSHSDDPGWEGTAEDAERFERLLDEIKIAGTIVGTVGDGSELIDALRAGAIDYKSFGEWASKVKGMDAGALLSLAGMGITAKELGEAIGSDDPAAIFESSLDLIMGAVGVKVPGAGLAWDIGKFLGESGYNSVQTFYDSPGGALDFAARQVFGDGATFEGLSQFDRDILMKRYDGMGGLLVGFVDTVGGTWDDFWKFVGGGPGRGPAGS